MQFVIFIIEDIVTPDFTISHLIWFFIIEYIVPQHWTLYVFELHMYVWLHILHFIGIFDIVLSH